MAFDYLFQTADGSLYGCLKELARRNRSNPTEAERVLWHYLRGNGLGQEFKRQHVIGGFIADFVCLTSRLVVETDGRYHQAENQQAADEERTKWLNSRGLQVMRFTNEEVIGNTEGVLRKIKEKLK